MSLKVRGRGGSIVCKLLNQLEDNMKTLNLEHRYTKYFIPHTELGYDPVKSTQYLKDDILYFSVSDHRSWLQCTTGNSGAELESSEESSEDEGSASENDN